MHILEEAGKSGTVLDTFLGALGAPQAGFTFPSPPPSREEELLAQIQKLEAKTEELERDLTNHRFKLIEFAVKRDEARSEISALQQEFAKVKAERDLLEEERWDRIYSCDGA